MRKGNSKHKLYAKASMGMGPPIPVWEAAGCYDERGPIVTNNTYGKRKAHATNPPCKRNLLRRAHQRVRPVVVVARAYCKVERAVVKRCGNLWHTIGYGADIRNVLLDAEHVDGSRMRRSERFEYRVLDDNRAHAPQVELSVLMLGVAFDEISGHGIELARELDDR